MNNTTTSTTSSATVSLYVLLIIICGGKGLWSQQQCLSIFSDLNLQIILVEKKMKKSYQFFILYLLWKFNIMTESMFFILYHIERVLTLGFDWGSATTTRFLAFKTGQQNLNWLNTTIVHFTKFIKRCGENSDSSYLNHLLINGNGLSTSKAFTSISRSWSIKTNSTN